MPFDHDRAFYRVPYPPPAAPHFVANGVRHRIVDIGEGGFRYVESSDPVPAQGDTVRGTIEFPEDDPLEVEGVVVRYRDGEIAVHCNNRPIPLALVLREQRRLRRRFPFGQP
jgi:hypothetical protein